MVVWRIFISSLIGLVFINLVIAKESPLSKDRLVVGPFSSAQPGENSLPADWGVYAFSSVEKQTRYGLVSYRGSVAVEAQSQAAAAALIRYLKFDAQQYPWLTWSWQIERVLEAGDLLTKSGDDYAARIYVGFEFEPHRASWWERLTHSMASASVGRELPGTILTYIWANQALEGTVVNSPFANQAKMMVLQSGDAKAGQWVREQRNIVEDYQLAFGREPPPAISIGLMTDSDNTGESTSALYGDIYLSPDA